MPDLKLNLKSGHFKVLAHPYFSQSAHNRLKTRELNIHLDEKVHEGASLQKSGKFTRNQGARDL